MFPNTSHAASYPSVDPRRNALKGASCGCPSAGVPASVSVAWELGNAAKNSAKWVKRLRDHKHLLLNHRAYYTVKMMMISFSSIILFQIHFFQPLFMHLKGNRNADSSCPARHFPIEVHRALMNKLILLPGASFLILVT